MMYCRVKHCSVSEQFLSLQVSVPLLQCTIGSDSSSVPGTPSRAVGQNGAVAPGTPKTGMFNHPLPSTWANQSSSVYDPLDQRLKLHLSEEGHRLRIFFLPPYCRHFRLQQPSQHASDEPELQRPDPLHLPLHPAAGPGDVASLFFGTRGYCCSIKEQTQPESW